MKRRTKASVLERAGVPLVFRVRGRQADEVKWKMYREAGVDRLFDSLLQSSTVVSLLSYYLPDYFPCYSLP
jgi:hypothetical protein